MASTIWWTRESTGSSLSRRPRRDEHGHHEHSGPGRLSGLRKTHRGGFEALRGIDFEIERGETFALLGPNGAGKSTTIENLEGYRDPSAGEAPVLGEDPRRAGLA